MVFQHHAQFIVAAVLLLTAAGQLQGLSLLQQIDPMHRRAREYLALSWFHFVVMSTVAAIGFVLFQLQIDGGLIFGSSLLAWLSGVGSFWSLLFGLRRVGELCRRSCASFSESYLCQLLLGFFLVTSIFFFATLIGARSIQRCSSNCPSPCGEVLPTQSPTLLVAASVMLLLYVHCLCVLWRACVRAQREMVK